MSEREVETDRSCIVHVLSYIFTLHQLHLL